MAGIGNDHSPGTASVGSINQLSLLPPIANQTLNRGRLGANNGNYPIGRHDITKANINELDIHHPALILTVILTNRTCSVGHTPENLRF